MIKRQGLGHHIARVPSCHNDMVHLARTCMACHRIATSKDTDFHRSPGSTVAERAIDGVEVVDGPFSRKGERPWTNHANIPS